MLLVLVNQKNTDVLEGELLIYPHAQSLMSNPDITEVLAAFYQNLTKAFHKLAIKSLIVQLKGVISA